MASHRGLDEKDRETVDELQRAGAPVVYEIIRQEGAEDLERPFASLWWSGIAAGLAISASIFTEGFLRLHLPDAPWRPLIDNLGYSMGFLLVILGGFQFFTEQTVRAILPLLSDPTGRNLLRTARLWAVVLVANLVGAFAAALFGTMSPGTSPEQLNAFLEISRGFAGHSFLELLMLGVPAGFLIAALTWSLPESEGNTFWIVVVVAYVIALGEFAHVIAGSVEAFLLLLAGEISLATTFGSIILPALIGNILGGTALFSLIAYGQVRKEM